MAELATIARPYAEALFKASQADLEGAAGWLEPLAAVAGDPQLRRLSQPRPRRRQRQRIPRRLRRRQRQ